MSVFPAIAREIKRALYATGGLEIVHGDVLDYRGEGSLLGWHQDSFDERRHLCTVVIELVNQTVCKACRSQQPELRDERLERLSMKQGASAPLVWTELRDIAWNAQPGVSQAPARFEFRRRCTDFKPFLQEWAPIVRSKQDAPPRDDADKSSASSANADGIKAFLDVDRCMPLIPS